VSAIAKHIIFKGSVQSVGFRYISRRIALKYDLTGYVKNLSDGTVEMFIQGEKTDVDYCIEDVCTSFSSYIRDKNIKICPVQPQYVNMEITF
jgi:acylphosphatase